MGLRVIGFIIGGIGIVLNIIALELLLDAEPEIYMYMLLGGLCIVYFYAQNSNT